MSEPDYTTMSGAEFKREVGADPDKWAAAFRQRELPGTDIDTAEIAAWFRDAMEAAVKAAHRRTQREERDFLKEGIWKPGDALDDEGRTEYPPGRPR